MKLTSSKLFYMNGLVTHIYIYSLLVRTVATELQFFICFYSDSLFLLWLGVGLSIYIRVVSTIVLSVVRYPPYVGVF